ncbi:winged helix-turn-helix domain-containing protein [Novosphingobium sp.]|uniref:winged helix-turn-helix domain-containing protein n=1 Tax=Novosphingobium sp. TaxID=1874826 RepID=UPI0025ECFDD5|nr:winged helix-turn-helix domain-containing protein [Novosphingobium sp.]
MRQGSDFLGADDSKSEARGEQISSASLRVSINLADEPPFRLGGLAVNPPLRALDYADGSAETLEPRVMEVLVALCRATGSVMSRDDLTAACWGGTVVGEDAIQRVIQRLRKVADRAESFAIETITKAGYRLVESVTAQHGARGDAPSLAVLPFANRSGRDKDEGLAWGFGEDLVDALSQGVNVRVLASSATAKFRDRPLTDFPGAARRLGVRYFLEGNIRRTGETFRVTAQLIEAGTSAIVWSQRFEGEAANLAELQGDLVTEVAAALGATIYKLEMDRALRKPSNLTAWECTARALAAIREYGAEPLARSIAESLRAIEIAPDYGLARATYALAVAGAYLSVSLPDPATENDIQVHIDRALVLDPDNAGVLAAIASASAYIGRPHEGLPRALRAIRLRPGHGLAHYAAAVCALLSGQEREGIRHCEDFLNAEPESHLHYITHAWRGIANARLRDYPAAKAALADSLGLFPGNFIALLVLTGIAHDQGQHKEAADRLSLARKLEPDVTLALSHARIARFFAGSTQLDVMQAAISAVWVQAEA